MGREVELKLDADPAAAESLPRHPLLAGIEPAEQEQLSVYFDTPRGKLRKAGYTLRVRRSGAAFVQTIKAAKGGAGLFDRGEWEEAVAALEPSAAAAMATPVRDVLSPRGFDKLVPVVRSEIRRTVWPVTLDGSEIELILDRGVIRGGEAEQSVNEVEVELRSGEAAGLMAFAQRLGEEIPLRLGVLTKAERGFALAEGSLGKVAKAPPVQLDATMSAGEGFTAIALSCLKHFRLNEPILVEQRLVPALHQARVAMRRLRSALSLFRPVIRDDPDYVRMREELRWFTNQLGEARNLDVYLARLAEDAPERGALGQAREESYDAIVAVLASQRFRAMMLDLVGWLLLGEWRNGSRAALPLPLFTANRIDRQWRDIELCAGQLAELEEEPRHRLRIEIKKIRYALEFVQELHRAAGAKQKRFAAALGSLQDSLGHLNDMATARQIALEHHLPLDEADEDRLEAEERRLVADADQAFDRLIAIGPYWRRPAGRSKPKRRGAGASRRRA